MIYAEDQDHFRQRRSLTPAFSNKALRSVTAVFYDTTYKVKAYWSAMFESSDEVVIDVQKWCVVVPGYRPNSFLYLTLTFPGSTE